MTDSGMSENRQRQLGGKLYYAFTPENIKARERCAIACQRYNQLAGEVTRRERVQRWRDIVGDDSPLPPQAATPQEDEDLFAEDAWVEAGFRADYGINVMLGANVYININCFMIDTCKITIGARTLVASNVSFFAGSHPLDPEVRNGTKGPEWGMEIEVGEDCWIGGNVTILPGVKIGKGSVVGAASVVTKSIPEYKVVAGNPARIIKDVPRGTKEEVTSGAVAALERDQAKAKQQTNGSA